MEFALSIKEHCSTTIFDSAKKFSSWGLNNLSEARKTDSRLKHSNLTQKHRYIYGMTLYLSEEQARNAQKLYDHTTDVEIEIPENFLNNYLVVEYKVISETEEEEVRIERQFKLDEKKFIEDWTKNKCPKKVWTEEFKIS